MARSGVCSVKTLLSGLLVFPLMAGVVYSQTTSITSSGLNTHVAAGSIDPAGRQNYDITGGTRPGNGSNLFHSFGDFSLGTNNVARFLNDSGLATNNILSRVTGGHVSNIFGEINTTNFPGANLYLINPAGVVFGPTASLNVSGSVYVSTADYLRLADGLRFNATSGPQDAILSQAPVVAFGFLNPHPRPITVQGATLDVQKHSPNEPARSLSLVGGDIQLTSAALKAEAGINLMSTGSQGEVRTDAAPGGITPPTLGKITMGNSLLDTAAPELGSIRRSGPIVIRGGQLVMDQSTITASVSGNAGQAQFNSGEVTLQLTDAIRVNESHIVSNGGGTNLGVVSLEAGHAIRLTKSTLESDNVFGDPGGPAGRVALKAPVIMLDGSHVSATGHTTCCGASSGGSVTIQADRLDLRNGSELTAVGYQTSPNLPGGTVVINATDTVLIDHSSINASGLPGGNAGSISITAGEAVRLAHSEIMAEGNTISLPPLPGHGGNIVIDAGKTFVGQSSTVSARSKMFDGGNIGIQASDEIRLNDSLIITQAGGTGAGGNITLTSEVVRLQDNAAVQNTVVNGPGGDIHINGRTVTVEAGAPVIIPGTRIYTSSEGTGKAGNIIISSTGVVTVTGSATGIRSESLGTGNTGDVIITAPILRVQDRARVDTFTRDAGQTGNIALDVGNLLIRSGGAVTTDALSRAASSGNISIKADTITLQDGAISAAAGLAGGGTGAPGTIEITTGRLTLQPNSIIRANTAGPASGGKVVIHADETIRIEGSFVDVSTSGGDAGTIVVDAGTNVVVDSSRLLAETTRGEAGQITISAGNGVRLLSGTVVSANNLRQGAAGTIVLDAGDNVLVDASRITAEPIQGQPGQIHITAGESVRVVNGSRLTVNNNGVGPAGILTVEAGTSVVGENSRFVAQTGEGHGGMIRITAPDRVRLTNSIVSTGVGGSSGSVGGTVEIASETVRVENGRIVSNASNGSGGTVTIRTNDFRPDAASVVEALSLGGGGADGRVSIQPLP